MTTTGIPPITAATTSTTGHRRPWGWVGPTGAILLFAAAVIPFLLAPDAAGGDAAASISAFYADTANRTILTVSEPLALAGAFLMLWFAGNLRELLRQAGGDDRRATVAFAGLAAFTLLVVTSVLVQTTPAGQLAFSSGFQLDPYTAMLFHHLGYVLLVAGLVGGAVAATATGAVIRHTGVLPRWTAVASNVVAVLSLLALPFVYVPLVVFTVWAVVIGTRLRAALADG